jgi:hypothetical protein
MNPTEYLDFRKEDFKYNCITENRFSESDIENFLVTILDYIDRFKEVRNSESLTDVIVDELIRKCESQVWIGTTFESNKYLFLTHWITKSIWQDKSYYWAKIRLGQFHNRRAGGGYDVTNELMSYAELFELLKAENKKKQKLPKYTSDNKFLIELYRVCFDNSILTCTELQFLTSTAIGDFSDIDFTFKTRGQYLVYQMKTIVGNDWYENTIKSKGWTKDDCNGFGKNFHESNGWADKVYQLIANYHKPLKTPKNKFH